MHFSTCTWLKLYLYGILFFSETGHCYVCPCQKQRLSCTISIVLMFHRLYMVYYMCMGSSYIEYHIQIHNLQLKGSVEKGGNPHLKNKMGV